MASMQQFSLKWNNYPMHITDAFESLRAHEDLVDVTLSCEGKKIKAHKMLLSACSSYFKEIFKDNPCQHPVIIFRNVKYDDLESLVLFMYQGEVSIVQDQLSSFLNTAELLEIKGLTRGASASRGDHTDENIDATAMISEATVQGRKQIVSRKKIPSPVPSQAGASSPPLKKRRKLSMGEGDRNENNVGIMNIKHEFSDNESPEPDEASSVEGAQNDVGDQQFGVNPSDDSGEGLSYDRGAGTSNDGCLQDSLQVLAHGLWRKLHPSLKQFGCDECGKVFKHPRSLDHHKKMHEGRTTCPVCLRVFGRMYALRLHVTSSHPDQLDLLTK